MSTLGKVLIGLLVWFLVLIPVAVLTGKFLKWHNTPAPEPLEPPPWVNHTPRAPVRVYPENGEVPVTIKEEL